MVCFILMTAGLCIAELKPTVVKTGKSRLMRFILMTAGLCAAEFKPTLVKTDIFR